MTQEKAMTTETPATQRLELLRNFKKYLEKQIAELEGESATLSEAARDFILGARELGSVSGLKGLKLCCVAS
jgi:hypothetical protein